MTSVVEQVQAAILTVPADAKSAEELRRMREFVEEASAKGLIVRRAYDLPLVDTISRLSNGDAPRACVLEVGRLSRATVSELSVRSARDFG